MNTFSISRRTLMGGAAAISALRVVPSLAQDADVSGELTLWHGWTGAEADTLNNDILPAWSAAYPNVKITTLAVPFDQLKAKYSTEAATGGGPDLLISALDWVGELADADLIQPVGDLLGADAVAQFLPATIEALTIDGTLWAVPESFEAVALYRNTTLAPEAPVTTAEMETMSAAITAANPDVYGTALRSGFYHTAGYLFGFGAELFDDANMSTLNSPETVNFLNWLLALQEKPGFFLQNDDDAVNSLFKTGKAAMLIQGPWALGDFQSAVGAENLAVSAPPKISEYADAAAAPFLGVKNVVISSNSEGDQATLAATFATWFTGPESVAFLVEKAGHLPANIGVDVSANPIAAGFVETAKSATPTPTIPEMGQVWAPADDMIAKVLSETATAEEAAAQAAETINSAIENMGA